MASADELGSLSLLMNRLRVEDDPPFPGAVGQWVPTGQFIGKKSFGKYTCKCGARWVSAHAQPRFKQECKTCKDGYYPEVMWRNDPTVIREARSQTESKPHLASLCEACKRGCCTSAKSLY
eukprot:m.19941 g.19941  ORF g.19941 m.19941 type:complete len:121 (-) comp5504_c0_seq1:158-520(-)